ncbi:YcdB/YcdC domain-containing protein [Anoxynatronum buryatiense]|uniref:S-layer homology domain-containing protein n=1 Tax=Anoxynatronum buryatiense TaxID=489973 RepID=A0AA46AK47_9CLOT|nr:YcdB/YcdC domain-containing protein [Anoxynatronum buryatiense]SMP67894.1 S-layer homology domain-containing protein [Anoxynatronum buryatiense]
MSQKQPKWLVLLLVAALVAGSLNSVFALTATEPVIATEAAEMPVTTPEATMDMPLNGGQDFIEPGVTPEMSREHAVEIATEALRKHAGMDVTTGNFQLNTEYRRDWQLTDRYVWNLYWYLSDPMNYASANVTLDAGTGEIMDLSQDRGSYGEVQRPLLQLTRHEARQKAESFIQQLFPGRLADMQLRENPENYMGMAAMGTYQYSFNYVRQIDGIIYDANFVNISIDGSTGEIKWFGQRWETDPELPDAQGIISESQARSRLTGLMQSELFYLPLRNEFTYESIPSQFRLAYRMDASMVSMINAKTGQPVDWSGQDDILDMLEKDLTPADKEAIAAQAVPVSSLPQPLNQQQAEEIALSYIRELAGKEAVIQAANYMEGDHYWETVGRSAWNLDFTLTESEEPSDSNDDERMMMPGYTNGRVMVNARTGELIAFNWWQYMEGPYGNTEKPALSWEEGYDMAIEMIAAYHPGRINEIRTWQRSLQQREIMDGQVMQPTEYYYYFPRIIEGIVFDENNLSVGINATTGTVTNYTDRWSDTLTLPRAENLMTARQGMEALLKNYRLELAYLRYNTNYDSMYPEYETKLVYRWMFNEATSNYPYVDAQDGTQLDYNGRALPQQDSQGFDARISGHWVERTARLLAQQGILDTTSFDPDEPVTRMDAVKMMVKARGMDYYGPMMEAGGDEKVQFVDVSEADEDYRYLQWAIRYGYIDNQPQEFQREATITREDLALWMTRFMGYRQLADATHIFQVPYADADTISQKALGAVAINYGLGIINGTGQFRPQDEATMAETADILYKAVAQQRR